MTRNTPTSTFAKSKTYQPYIAQNVPYDGARPVSAIIVGAGIAGIAAAVLLKNKVPNLTYTVIEKNKRVGGTWAENTYPGVRCDVPSHSYQLSFEPNPNWSEFYSQGPELQQYYENVVKKHGVDKHLQLQTQVTKAIWSVTEQQWIVDILNLVTHEIGTIKAHFFISAAGRLNDGVLPAIEDLESFGGHIRHSTNWDHDYDYSGKRVAVLGNGASGAQIVPNLLPRVSRIDHYSRSKNWVSPFFRPGLPTVGADNPGGHLFTDEEKKNFVDNPEAYLEYRKNLDVKFYTSIKAGVLGSPENAAFRESLSKIIHERANGDQELIGRLVPDFAPGCKRLTPAPGYIEALQSPKVDWVTDGILKATPTGLIGVDGVHREVDAIVAATGFSGDHRPRFPIIGLENTNLQDQWALDGPVGLPDSYLGIMAPGFPNYFFILQIQGTALGGVVPLQCEISATYIAKCIRKIQSQSYTSLHPSIEATEDFNAALDGFGSNRVSADTCHSWWKSGPGNTRILVSWPGSGFHRFDNMRDPRWEDFNFQRTKRAEKNRFEHFGNGYTKREERADRDDLTKYLKPVGQVNLQTLHESWTD